MRTIKELLPVLKDQFLKKRQQSLCIALSRLYIEQRITEKEKDMMEDYIHKSYKPEVVYDGLFALNRGHMEFGPKSYYLWEPKRGCPKRIKWLNKQIKKWEEK